MKKIIALFISVLLVFSCSSFGVLADEIPDKFPEEYPSVLSENGDVTFSQDFKTIYVGEEVYIRCSNEHIYNDIIAELDNKIILSSEQKEEVEEVSLTCDDNGALIAAEIFFTDGAYLFSYYIKEEYLEEYNKILAHNFTKCEVDFAYPAGNTVKLDADALNGKKHTIKDTSNNVEDYFPVLAYTSDGKIIVEIGIMIVSNGEYYYASYEELGSNRNNYYIYDVESVTAHKITDENVILSFTKAQERYYSSDLGFFYDDTFTEKIADIFIVLIFAVIPFAVLVVFAIFAIRSIGIYRKMCIIGAAISAAELIVFAIIALMVI